MNTEPSEELKKLKTDNAALRAELEWVHWHCMDFAHDAVSTCRICRLLKILDEQSKNDTTTNETQNPQMPPL